MKDAVASTEEIRKWVSHLCPSANYL